MHSYWWFKPHIVTTVWTLPLLFIAIAVPEEWYFDISGTAKFLDFEEFTVGLIGLLFFIGGAWLGTRPFFRFSAVSNSLLPLSVRETPYRQVMYTVFLVTSVAYIIWFQEYFVNPSLIVPIFRGDPGAIYAAREVAERLPGITSFTNVAPLYAVLYALYSRVTGAPLRVRDKLAMGLFVFITVARVFIYSERTGLLWLVVPFVLAAAGGAAKRRQMIVVLPVIIAIAGVFLFAIGEYFRSWANYYVDHWDSYWSFILNRLGAYYVTALNNGAGMYKFYGPKYIPMDTLDWFWKFPIQLVPGGMAGLFNVDTTVHHQFLESVANPEYNNRGLFTPMLDFGIVGGTVVFAFLGWFSGQLYYGFTKGTALGLLLYPSWYVCILEMARWFAFGSTRYFILVVVTSGVIFMLNRHSRHRSLVAVRAVRRQ